MCGAVWTVGAPGQVVETMDLEVSYPVFRIREHRERQDQSVVAVGEGWLRLSGRPAVLDGVEAIATCARGTRQSLGEGESAEARVFTGLLVKETVVAPLHSSDAQGPATGGQARRGVVPEEPGAICGHRWRASRPMGHAGRTGIFRIPRRPNRAPRVSDIDSRPR